MSKRKSKDSKDIIQVLTNDYVDDLGNIVSILNNILKGCEKIGFKITNDDFVGLIHLRFNGIHNRFEIFLDERLNRSSLYEENRETLKTTFNDFIDEWRSVLYARRMNDGEPYSSEIASLFVFNDGVISLVDGTEEKVRAMFEEKITSEDEIRLAEIQVNLRNDLQDLSDLFDGVRMEERPGFMKLFPHGVPSLFRFEERNNKNVVICNIEKRDFSCS